MTSDRAGGVRTSMDCIVFIGFGLVVSSICRRTASDCRVCRRVQSGFCIVLVLVDLNGSHGMLLASPSLLAGVLMFKGDVDTQGDGVVVSGW
jgi:hypothetical protein